MGSPIAVLIMRILEILFFVGLAGAAVTILASWISVLYGCFRDDPGPPPAPPTRH